jgi:hypothetical protein
MIDRIAGSVVDATEGHSNPLELYIDLMDLKSHLDDFIKTIKPHALQTAEMWKGQVFHGKKIALQEGGRWDYSGIPEIKELQDRIKELQKNAQSAAKQAERGLMTLDEDVVIQPAVYRPNQTSIRLEKV